MAWITTFSGMKVDVFDPDPNTIKMVDIAHSLSQICRYNGHCSSFYSVGIHSIYCATVAAFDLRTIYQTQYNRVEQNWDVDTSKILDPKGGRKIILRVLLHDAAEAYIGDLPRPIKKEIPQFSKIEDNLLNVILDKYGVGDISSKYLWFDKFLKNIDNRILASEMDDIMSKNNPTCCDAIPFPEIKGLFVEPPSIKRTKNDFLHWFEWCMNVDMEPDKSPTIDSHFEEIGKNNAETFLSHHPLCGVDAE